MPVMNVPERFTRRFRSWKRCSAEIRDIMTMITFRRALNRS
jgi:hypothetical protein